MLVSKTFHITTTQTQEITKTTKTLILGYF